MAIAQGPMSGFRDLLAEQMIPRDRVIETIKKVYELYGFVPIKTPALEHFSTLTGKYGEEGDKLMYSFEDNGGRKVAMRYDQTVPLARVVAQYGETLPSPYKRYVVGDVWRGESPQAGRYREFAQFDADIVGTSSNLADTEIIAMMSDSMAALGLEATIKLNDRRLLDGLAEACGLKSKSDFYKLVGSIDKVEKVGAETVLKEVLTKFGAQAVEIVGRYLAVTGTNKEKLAQVAELITSPVAKQGIENLTTILELLESAGYIDGISFDPTIARGLAYYTGTIYETSLNKLPQLGSICSGGRFDKLIEQLGGPDLPSVGTSIGVDRLIEGMRQLGALEEAKTNTKVYITNVEPGLDQQRFNLVQRLRKSGVAAELTYDSPKLGKQIKAVDKIGVAKIIILGSQELENSSVVIKDLSSGEQKTVPIDQVVSEFEASK